MANTLMFDVGIDWGRKKLSELERQLQAFDDTWSNKLKIKVQIEDLTSVVRELNKLGDNKGLQQLRAELAEVNNQFLQLSKGAGGAGSLASRGVAQESERIRQDLEKVTQSLSRFQKEYNDALTARSKTKPNSDLYKSYTREMENAQTRIDGAQSSISKLEAQLTALTSSTNQSSVAAKAASEQTKQYEQQIIELTNKTKTLEAEIIRMNGVMAQGGSRMTGQMIDAGNVNALRDAVAGVVAALTAMKAAFENLGSSEGITSLNAKISSLYQNVNSVVELMSRWSGALKLNMSAEEIAGYEKKIQELKTSYDGLTQKVASLQQNLEAASSAQQKISEAAKKATGEQTLAAETSVTAGQRWVALLYKVENLMASIGSISRNTELLSGFNPSLLSKAYKDLEAMLQELRRNQDGSLPVDPARLEQLKAQFASIKQQYGDVVKEADRYNKQTEQGEQQKAKAMEKAHKDIQAEIDRTISKIKELDAAISRGVGAGRDMTALSDARSRLIGQNMLLSGLTASDFANSSYIASKISNIRTLREDTDALLKSEEKLTAAREKANKQQAIADTKKLDDEIKSLNEAWIKYNELGAKIRELQSLRQRGELAHIDLTQIDAAINRFEQLRSKMAEIITHNGRSVTGNLTKEILGGAGTKKEILSANAEVKSYSKSLADVERRMRAAGTTAENLGKHLDRLEAKRIDFQGLDTSRFDNALQRIRQIKAELERFAQTGVSSYGTNANAIVRSMNLAAANKAVKDSTAELSAQLKQSERDKQSSANATNQLTESELRLSNALRGSTDAMKSQSQVLSDLRTMAMQYLSVWGAQSFVNKIIETGGLLEQQRLSMGAILQDAEKANEIFEQIKALAVKSPFGVVQLDQMSKQLAAYGFESEELFEWTKRLADISAATGTEVSRLSLALGHVRSEGALSGYTLRQFSMGNVPLLRMLAEERGVSTKEIRDLVRKKEISDKEVSDILKKLTDEGGMFYNAQEVMSEALNAKFKNLRDAFDIMYGEIAESNVGEFLKGIATTMTQVAKAWETAGRVLATIGASFAVAKVAMLTYNSALSAGTANTLKSALADKKKEVNLLRLAQTYRTLSLAEQSRIATSARLHAADIRQLLITKKLTTEELLRAVAMGKLSRQSAILAVQSMNLEHAQKRLLLSQLQSMEHTRRWSMMWMSLGNAIRTATSAMFAFGKMILPMAAISAIVGLWSSRREDISDSREVSDTQANKLLEKYKAVRDLREQLIEKAPRSAEERDEAIEHMIDALKDAGEYNKNLEAQVESIGSVDERYRILHNTLVKVSNDYERMRESLLAYLEVANDSGGSSFLGMKTADNIKTDSEDLTRTSLEVTKAEMEITKNASIAQKALLAYFKERGVYTEQMANLEWKELYAMMANEEARQEFFSFMKRQEHNASNNDIDVTPGAANAISDAFARYRSALKSYWSDWEEIAENDMGDFASAMGAAFTQTMQKVDPTFSMEKATEKQKKEFADFLDKAMDEWKNTSQSVKDAIKGETLYTFWKVRFVMQPDITPLEAGMQSQLDYMQSSPMGYSFYIGNMQKTLQGKGQFFSLDDVKKAVGDVKASNVSDAVEKLKTKKDELEKDNQRLRSLGRQTEEIRQQIAENEKNLNIINAFGNDIGVDWDLFNKSDKGGSKEDAILNSWKKRISLLEKYRQEMEKLTRIMSREEATRLLREDGGFGALWVGDLNPEDYNDYLEKAKKILGVSGKRKEYTEELSGKQAQENMRRHTDDIKDQVSELGRLLSIQRENYDVYKRWVVLTGNEKLAAGVAGVTQNSSYADYLKEEFAKRGGEAVTRGSAEAFFQLSESEARKYGEESGLYKLWEQWQDNSKKIRQEEVSLYENSIKNAKGYAEKVADITRELEREKKAIDAVGGADSQRLKDNADKKARQDIAQLTWENFKNTEEWGRVFGNLDRMSTETLGSMLEKLRSLAPSIKEDTEATKALYEAIAKIEKSLASRNPLMSMSNALSRASALSKVLKDMKGYDAEGSVYINDRQARSAGIQGGWRNVGDVRREAEEGLRGAEEDVKASLQGLTQQFKAIQDALTPVINLFEELGETTISDFFKMGSDALGAAAQMGSGAAALFGASAGPWGAAAGAALSIATSLIGQHDSQLQRQIEMMQDEVNALEANTAALRSLRSRTLGYDEGTLFRNLSNAYEDTDRISEFWSRMAGQDVYVDSAAKRAMKEYYKDRVSGSGYSQELANLNKERDKYIQMYDAENDKKKKSRAALDEYQEKIHKLDEEIAYFTEDLAKDLWGLDIKSWADQLGDALVSAWENGEDAAKAFEKTSNDIMKSVLNEMFKIGVLEPTMKRLRLLLFGGTDSYGNTVQGAFNAENAQYSAQSVATIIGDELRTLQTQTDAWKTVYDELRDAFGITSVSSSSASGGIRSVTEQTADLLASYVNAIRGDVSVDREMIAQYFPMYYTAMTSCNASLANIESHTAAIMMNSDMLARSNQSILDRIDGLKNKTWKVPVA